MKGRLHRQKVAEGARKAKSDDSKLKKVFKKNAKVCYHHCLVLQLSAY